MVKSFAWSYSALSSFETCPRRHNLTKIAKTVTERQSEQMLWGNKVHKALELRLKNKTPLAAAFVAYEPHIQSIERVVTGGGVADAEQKMGIDINYNPVGFFAPNIWARAITDVTVTKGLRAAVIDWKTGKPTPASAQLKLCAAMTFHAKPYLKEVVTSFMWLVQGTTTNEVYTKGDLPDIWNEFHPRVRRMEQAIESDNFPPKPSGLCREWCPVPRSMCEHSGKT